MTKHTPGPWHVHTHDQSIGTIEAEDGTMVAQAQQVKPRHEDIRQEERRANARLIAAAPELLAACLELCHMVEMSHRGRKTKAYLAARSAADKATRSTE